MRPGRALKKAKNDGMEVLWGWMGMEEKLDEDGRGWNHICVDGWAWV